METNSEINTGTFIHLSSLSQYFIPFGNYIFPIMIWTFKRDKSQFIDFNGKQVLNFQLSILVYSLILAIIAIPIFIFIFFGNIPLKTLFDDHNNVFNHVSIENISGLVIIAIIALLLFVGLKVVEFFLIIYASLKTANGEKYRYPLTIPFIK